MRSIVFRQIAGSHGEGEGVYGLSVELPGSLYYGRYVNDWIDGSQSNASEWILGFVADVQFFFWFARIERLFVKFYLCKQGCSTTGLFRTHPASCFFFVRCSPAFHFCSAIILTVATADSADNILSLETRSFLCWIVMPDFFGATRVSTWPWLSLMARFGHFVEICPITWQLLQRKLL